MYDLSIISIFLIKEIEKYINGMNFMQSDVQCLVLPKILVESGFSLDTHLFRYRSDSLIKNDDGAIELGYGVKELLTNSIWHSCISALNDPFEVYFQQNDEEAYTISDSELFFYWVNSFESNKHQREVLEGFFKENNEDIRRTLANNISSYIHILKETFRTHTAIACFSTCCDSRLMWGYYCSGFKGFCLIYNKKLLENNLTYLNHVVYSKHRPKLDVISFFIRRKRNENVSEISNLAIYKHAEWIHEKELRSILMIDNEHSINDGGFSIQLNGSCVDGVIIGEGCNEKTKEEIILSSKKRGIKIFYAHADLDLFNISIS